MNNINHRLTEKTINDCYKKAGELMELSPVELASEAMSFYVAYRVVSVLEGGVKYYNEMHEMLMDLSVDISDDIIKNFKEFNK